MKRWRTILLRSCLAAAALALGLALVAGGEPVRLLPPSTAPTAPLLARTDPATRLGSAWQVLSKSTAEGGGDRRDRWRCDFSLPEAARVDDTDYLGDTGDDRGHCAPAADYGPQHLKDATFNYANCAPQNRELNRGLWASIERIPRNARDSGATVYVRTSPLILPDGNGKIETIARGPHRLIRPTHWAKAMLADYGPGRGDGRYEMAAWLAPNSPPVSSDPASCRVSVDRLEFELGENLFYWLPQPTQERLEGALP